MTSRYESASATLHNELWKSLTTPRLDLIPATATLVRAELEDRETFFRLLGVWRAKGWPPADTVAALPHFLQQLEGDPSPIGWLSWYWVLRGERGPTLVGSGGFKGPPGIEEAVEIGYYVRPAYRRYGYATEAVTRLVNWALSHGEVKRITAETRLDNVPSIGVLERVGFKQAGEGSEPGLIRFELARTSALRHK